MKVLLLGHPVSHSLSPVMQNAAFAALARDDVYEAVDVPSGKLTEHLDRLRDGQAYLGANVTVPYKVDVAGAVDELDGDARLLGAVNTVVVRDGRLAGYNTDVEGASKGLLGRVQESLFGAHVLVLGAGGGARAMMLALSRSPAPRPGEVLLAARRTEAALALLALAQQVGLQARVVPWWELAGAVGLAAVLVNATPLGLDDEADPFEGMPLEGRVVLDLAYRPGGTPLVRRAEREGAVALQGDEMLLHQGAAAFTLWTGEDAPLEAMRTALARAMEETLPGTRAR